MLLEEFGAAGVESRWLNILITNGNYNGNSIRIREVKFVNTIRISFLFFIEIMEWICCIICK